MFVSSDQAIQRVFDTKRIGHSTRGKVRNIITLHSVASQFFQFQIVNDVVQEVSLAHRDTVKSEI